MASIRKTVLVPFTAEQIYNLVERVEDYPLFLPWCNGSQVQERTREGMIATVSLGLHGVHQSFTTVNTHEVGRKIALKLQSGPFSSLNGQWNFEPLSATACKVTLQLDYQFASSVLAKLIAPVFDPIANSLIDAFVSRAEQVYKANP
jgi:ribosome-associated toxin RatA of RatAB toxin-antitoxin module